MLEKVNNAKVKVIMLGEMKVRLHLELDALFSEDLPKTEKGDWELKLNQEFELEIQ